MNRYLIVACWCLSSTVCCCARQEPSRPAGTQPAAAQDCREHSECPSGVCSHYKADNGKCAPENCNFGERADNNHFFCNRQGRWERSRAERETCEKDFMCYQETCFMNPNCGLGEMSLSRCRDGRCVREAADDPCAAAGRKMVLAPEEYMSGPEEGCMQSMAQRVLRTVCVPCGNGTCDPQESACNCPEDCASARH